MKREMIRNRKIKKAPVKNKPETTVYAMYEFDRLICVGTMSEISEWTDLKIRTLRQYATPSHNNGKFKRSTIIVRVGTVDECK